MRRRILISPKLPSLLPVVVQFTLRSHCHTHTESQTDRINTWRRLSTGDVRCHLLPSRHVAPSATVVGAANADKLCKLTPIQTQPRRRTACWNGRPTSVEDFVYVMAAENAPGTRMSVFIAGPPRLPFFALRKLPPIQGRRTNQK